MNRTAVVDTNIFISALTSRNREILRVLSRPGMEFVSTNYIVVELFEHSPRIQQKTRLPREELLEVLSILIAHVRLVDDSMISVGNWIEARRLTREVDMDDITFVALSLELDAPLWTKDEKLRTHLIRKGFSNFFDPAL
jgi:predicted nucleic acid-binding protein